MKQARLHCAQQHNHTKMNTLLLPAAHLHLRTRRQNTRKHPQNSLQHTRHALLTNPRQQCIKRTPCTSHTHQRQACDGAKLPFAACNVLSSLLTPVPPPSADQPQALCMIHECADGMRSALSLHMPHQPAAHMLQQSVTGHQTQRIQIH